MYDLDTPQRRLFSMKHRRNGDALTVLVKEQHLERLQTADSNLKKMTMELSTSSGSTETRSLFG